MSVQLLDKTRKINKLLHNSTQKMVFSVICTVLSETLESNVSVISKKGKVLGVHMLGNPCSEIIQSGCIAIEKGMTAAELKDVVFPHPTVSEIIKETLGTL